MRTWIHFNAWRAAALAAPPNAMVRKLNRMPTNAKHRAMIRAEVVQPFWPADTDSETQHTTHASGDARVDT